MTDCPAEPRWRSLLADDVPPAEAASLAAHLETCRDCQHTLDLCAADATAWADVPRILAAPADEPALRDLIERLQHDPGTPADDPLDFLEPTTTPGSLGRLGPYEVLGEIGRGGMGIVLKALDPKLHRAVALKVLAPQLAVSAAARQRFTREARAAAAMCHPNVVAIHAVDEFRGLPYLVMQHVEGPSLQERIARDGPLPVDAVLTVGMQLAAGLAAAHARGLVHRDVKPANALLDADGTSAKLVDFGLARTADDVGLTRSGAITGTPQYMAPEQADGRPVDARADLYALGAVLYFATAGRPPFAGGHPLDVLRRTRDERPMPLRKLNPTVPAWLEGIVMRLLAKQPAERFASAAEVAALLERGLAHWRDPRRTPLPATLRPPTRRYRFVTLALCACAVLVGVVITLKTPEGTLVVEIDDPAVKVSVDGSELVITGAGVQELRVKPGEHRVAATRDDKAVSDEVVTVTSGGKQVVRVTREALAVGPAVKPTPIAEAQPKPLALPKPTKPDVPSRGNFRDGIPDQPGVPMVTGFPAKAPVRQWFSGDPSGERKAPRPDHEYAVEGFRRADRNGDGLLDAKEFSNQWPWIKFDTNGDGMLDLNEYKLMHKLVIGRLISASVKEMILTSDGKSLVTASHDGKVRVWDFAKGTQWNEIPPLPAGTLALAAHRDTSFIVAHAKGVTAFDPTGSKALWDYKSEVPILCVAINPNGKWVAAGGDDGTYGSRVILLDANNGTQLAEQSIPATPIVIAFDSSSAIVGSVLNGDDFELRIQTPGDKQPLFMRPGTRAANVRMRAIAVSGAAQLEAATTNEDPSRVRLSGYGIGIRNGWGAVHPRLHADGVVTAVALSRDGTLLLSADEKGMAKLWELSRLRRDDVNATPPPPMETLPCGDKSVRTAVFASDGKSVVTAGDDGVIRVWAVPEVLRPPTPPPTADGKEPSAVPAARPPDTATKPAREWDAKHPDGVTAFAVTPDGQFAVTAGRDGALRVWAVGDGTLRAEREAFVRNRAVTLAVSPDGKRVYSATEYGTLNAWDLPTADSVWSLPRDAVYTAVAASPDGKLVAVAGRGRLENQPRWIELARADTGAPVLRFDVTGETCGLAFGPNAADLDVLAGNGGTVTVYDAKTGRALRHLGVRSYPSAFARGPDGLRVIAGTQDDRVQFLSADGNGAFLRLHAGGTESLALSPDGKLLLSGGRDGTVRLWRVERMRPDQSGGELATLAAGSKPVRGVSLIAGGKLALAAGDDGVVRVWTVPTPQG